MRPRPLLLAMPVLVVAALALSAGPPAPVYDVRAFGAKGDGRTLDTPAIAAAIEAAAAAGGGTVHLPAGTYPSYSIHLKSHVTLQLGEGATLLAAEPSPERGRYDAPERTGVHFDHVRTRLAPGVPFALLRDVLGLSGHDTPGLPDTRRGPVGKEELTP